MSPISKALHSKAFCEPALWPPPTTATGNSYRTTSPNGALAKAALWRSTWKAQPLQPMVFDFGCRMEPYCVSATNPCMVKSNCLVWPITFTASALTNICASACVRLSSYVNADSTNCTAGNCAVLPKWPFNKILYTFQPTYNFHDNGFFI